MVGKHNTEAHKNAGRIVEWLLEHRTEFEKDGVQESSLSAAIGLSEDKIREAIDHLENHDDVVRFPEALSNPPRFLLKPARGWTDIVERQRGEKRVSGNV